LLKIAPFMRYCVAVWYSQTDHRWQSNMAWKRCELHAR